MESFDHANSSLHPRELSDREHDLYRAIVDGTPVVIATLTAADEGLADTLRLIAERIDGDRAVRALRHAGVSAHVIDTHRYHTTAIRIDSADPDEMCTVDPEAAFRIAQRAGSGLSLREAIARTLAQCQQPTLSEFRIRQMEREADAHMRRLNIEDKALLRSNSNTR